MAAGPDLVDQVAQQEGRSHLVHDLLVDDPSTDIPEALGLDQYGGLGRASRRAADGADQCEPVTRCEPHGIVSQKSSNLWSP